MVELSNERIEQILNDETGKTEDVKTILRGIYTRYVNLYERYFADFDKLNEEKIEAFKKYHEETRSLIKYYYMDIPQDVCMAIREFEEKGSDLLLGRAWKTILSDAYDEFREKSNVRGRSEEYYQAEFKKLALKEFYAAMETVVRDGFGTNSQAAQSILEGISGLLFGKKEKEK